jgi:single-strand DNA-binding protein
MANFNFNKVILGGRLTSDPELKTTPSGVSVTTFSLAVNRKYSGKGEEQQTDFINVTAWRGTAEFITKFFRKGSSLCIVGSLQVRSWTDKDGNKRYATDVVADEAMFVDAKSDSTASATNDAPPSYMPEAYSAPALESLSEDDDLPF